ncbi:MAG: GNAT family protein [Gammaproteobacteria bacterium]|nr:GNAT family protein [Gammaproteobacteria bacterium]
MRSLTASREKIMENQLNELGMTVGHAVTGWSRPPRPQKTVLSGQYSRLEPLNIDRHAKQLHEAYSKDQENRIWVYLPYGPFDDFHSFKEWLECGCLSDDPQYYAVINLASGQAEGVATYLRIKPDAGSIEVGHINYSPALQGTPAATEAMYLMMRNAFDLGYRRYEWKCNALNGKSCRAAIRLGFQYEGTFRQMMVVKGRNRDTAWYSMLDHEWPKIKQAFAAWLSPENFDESGQQHTSLSELMREARHSVSAS